MSIYMQLKYKTKFRDKEILKEALTKAKVKFTERNGEIICNTYFYELHFRKNTTGEYIIQTQGYNDFKSQITNLRDKVEKHYNELEKAKIALETKERQEQLRKQFQKQICDNIKTQVANSSAMYLEQEETLEDNSILLTIRV